MEEKKMCCTCKYFSTSYSEEPCKSCLRGEDRSNWVDALTEGVTLDATVPSRKFEVGDLVTVGYSKDIYVYLCDNIVMRVPYDVSIDYIAHSLTCRYYRIWGDGIDILKTNTNDFLKFASPVAMDRVEYATATEIHAHNATAYKDHPVILNDWILKKRKGNNMDKIKALNTPRSFKTGDIVVEKDDPMRSIKNIYIYLYDGWALRIPNYVVARSECNYNFSTYMYSLITEDFAELIVHPKHASSEDIIGHDHRARVFYIPETLNDWFGQLIERSPYIPHQSIIPLFGKEPEKKTTKTMSMITVHHMAGTRYDKYPTLNGNFIKKVIFSDPATIIFWEDGTKTVVKTQDGEEYDKEKGFAMAVCKKIFGNERDYYNVFKRWMRKGEERHEET